MKSKRLANIFDDLYEIDTNQPTELQVNGSQSDKFLRLLSDEESEGEKLVFESMEMSVRLKESSSNNSIVNKSS